MDGSDRSDGMPSFLTIYVAIDIRYGTLVAKDPGGEFERNTMFTLVAAILDFVLYENYCSYIVVALF